MRALLHICEGDLGAARELLLASLTWRSAGKHNEGSLAGLCVFVGMRAGDFALVDTMFDHRLLVAAAAAGDAELTGLLLPGFAEVMQARGLTRDLQTVMQSCLDQKLIDPYGLDRVNAGATRTAERRRTRPRTARRVLRKRERPDRAWAPCARRRGRRTARGALRLANDRARDAARRYGGLGWHLFEAFALEEGDDHDSAARLYRACGASADVGRLAAGQTRKRKRSPFGAQLTPREREVARLVARGRSDKDIARALEISVRTVHHHVEAVYSKLGVSGRGAVTGALLEDALAR
jgi:DNA-binding CsgD family transcriptional regulator